MGIYIKGMALPKDCWECQMFGTWEVGKFSCFFGAKVKDIDIRAIDCPLVEIPTPHGRLIEENKVVSRMVDSYANAGLHSEDYKKVCKYISQAPTILEAEE